MKRIFSLMMALFILLCAVLCASCDAPSEKSPSTPDSPLSTTPSDGESSIGTGDSESGGGGGGNHFPRFPGQKLTVSLSAPLTGLAATYGIAAQNGAQLAIDEINAQGGLANRVKLELLAYDDEHNPMYIASNYASMVENGAQVSLGCVTTSPCLEFAKLSKLDNLFFLTPTAGADLIVEQDNAYQMCYSDAKQGSAAAEYVNSLGPDKIGIFYKSDDAYSVSLRATFLAAIDQDISVVEASFIEQTSSDFTTQIEVLKNCEFIFMPIYYPPAALFMTQAQNVMTSNTVYFGCDAFDGIETAYGYDITAIPQKVIMLSQFDDTATEGRKGDFIKNYTDAYGTQTLNQFAACGYDAVYALAGAMNAAIEAGTVINEETTASELCEILKAQFGGDYVYKDAITSAGDATWSADGFVSKSPLIRVIKQAS